jgi:hypothetical protein
MHEHDAPAHAILAVLGGFQLRRAVLGILLSTNGPLALAEIVDTLRRAGYTTNPLLAKPPHGIIANLLDYQEGRGRVIRTMRGEYAVVGETFSQSTRWRYRNWQRLTR